MRLPPMPRLEYPDGARFAFSIIDDTDVATVANVRPMYRLLERLGMRATKTVWPMDCPEGSDCFGGSETLEDPEYLAFVLDLQSRGFEITWHCATMESSTRERTHAALERFRETFGEYPRVHANHALNRENLYWGDDRIDMRMLRSLYRRTTGTAQSFFAGHVADSAYWWGDLCAEHVSYVRNLTFNEVNLLRINPSMPYHDPARSLVKWWFSASDADDYAAFNSLLAPANQQRLEQEGGICIVATHFGKGFGRDGQVNPSTRRVLESLAGRRGWFPTVGELLDWLRQNRADESLPPAEWRRMQLRWAVDLVRRSSLSSLRSFRGEVGRGAAKHAG